MKTLRMLTSANSLHICLPFLAAGALLMGCASPGFGPSGGLFTGTTVGIYAKSTEGSKTGEACAMSILGLVAIGDGSVETAMQQSGIKQVNAIDLEMFSVLGVYAKTCTVIRGE